MSISFVIIDMQQRFPRDMFFLENTELKAELIHHCIKIARTLVPSSRIRVYLDSSEPSDVEIKTEHSALKQDDTIAWLQDLHEGLSLGPAEGVLLLSPMRGVVNKNRVGSLVEAASGETGVYASCARIGQNRHPSWLIGSWKEQGKDRYIAKKAMKLIGAIDDIPEHLRDHIPHPSSIKGGQFLPSIAEEDGAVVVLHGSAKENEAIRVVPVHAEIAFGDDSPFVYRLPIFDISQDTQPMQPW